MIPDQTADMELWESSLIRVHIAGNIGYQSSFKK